MAATKDRAKKMKEGKLIPFPVKANVKIYAGTFVCIDSAGYAIPGADAAGNRFAGIADAQADNLGGANGAINVLVWRDGVFEMPATSIALTSVGDVMYLVDDQTFDESNPGQGIIVGTLVQYESATKGWLDISTAVKAPALPTSGDALTVSDVGDFFAAADNTLAEQMQKVAGKPIVITLPRFTGWTKDGTDKTIVLPALELPYPVRVKRAYAGLGTAPGTGKTLALKLNDAALASIAEDAVVGEAEALDIAIAADTDFVIKANETAGGAGANCDIILIAQMDDGE